MCRTTISRRVIPALFLLAVATRSPTAACPYSIRDSAFIAGTAATPYQLQILVKGDAGSATTEEVEQWLSAASSTWLEDANVEARVVDVSDPDARDAVPDGFSIPSALPVAILVSPGGAAMTLPGIAPGKISLDAVMTTALGVVESPLRRNIQKRLALAWCVGLLVEGTDAGENVRARRAFEAAARSIIGRSTEMGKVVTAGPELLTVSSRSPEERVLLWSLGLDSTGEGDVPARALMLIGRGERRGPLLEGEEVTAEKLLEMFTMLGRSCSCTTDEMWLSGPSLPLEWSQEVQALVKAELGFDPRNPEALNAIKGVLDGASAASPFSEAALGYSETFLELEVEDAPARDPRISALNADVAKSTLVTVATDPEPSASETPEDLPADDETSSAMESGSSPEGSSGSFRAGHVALLALCGLALLGLAGATFIVLRRRD